MIEFFFLVAWSLLFFMAIALIWRLVASHIKVYVVLAIHCCYLTGLFWLYPAVLHFAGKL